MKYEIALLVWIASVAAVAAQGVPNGKLDPVILEKLQGTWEVVSEESNGQQSPHALVKSMSTVTFQGDTYRWGNGGTGRIVAIDASKKPIWIDYRYTSGPRNGQIDRAIIQIDGDTFMDCMPAPRAPRPNEFNTLPGDGRTLMTYRRVSDERGDGMLRDPFFYIAAACGLGTVGIAFVAGLIILVVWLGGRPKSGQKNKPAKRRRRNASPDDGSDSSA